MDEAIDELERRWPGLRDRLCEPGPALRRHIHVYVDRERAALDTPLDDALAGARGRRDQRRLELAAGRSSIGAQLGTTRVCSRSRAVTQKRNVPREPACVVRHASSWR